jgi:hypothetical protein
LPAGKAQSLCPRPAYTNLAGAAKQCFATPEHCIKIDIFNDKVPQRFPKAPATGLFRVRRVRSDKGIQPNRGAAFTGMAYFLHSRTCFEKFFPPAHDLSYGKNMAGEKMRKAANEIAAPVRKNLDAVIAISSPARGVRSIRALCSTTLKLAEAGYGKRHCLPLRFQTRCR